MGVDGVFLMVGMLGLLGMSRKMIAYSTIVWRVAVVDDDDDDDDDDDKQTFMFFLSLPFTRSS